VTPFDLYKAGPAVSTVFQPLNPQHLLLFLFAACGNSADAVPAAAAIAANASAAVILQRAEHASSAVGGAVQCEDCDWHMSMLEPVEARAVLTVLLHHNSRTLVSSGTLVY
jgi:hypothetical protein